MQHGYARAGLEPPLDEVLSDPVVHAVMRRDGVELREVEEIIAAAQRRLFPTAAELHGSSPREGGG
jgi:hypothetical protein